MLARAANAYRRVDLDSAPKTQIVDRLFSRCLADVEAARVAITARDVRAKAVALDHALQIIGELKAALDPSAAPELCANLAALYDFVTERLVTASLAMDAAALAPAVRVLGELAEAFTTAHTR
mgnify:CR=1 FL=1